MSIRKTPLRESRGPHFTCADLAGALEVIGEEDPSPQFQQRQSGKVSSSRSAIFLGDSFYCGYG